MYTMNSQNVRMAAHYEKSAGQAEAAEAQKIVTLPTSKFSS